MSVLFIQFNQDIQFFNEQGINDLTIKAYEDYIAFKEADKYRVKTNAGIEFDVALDADILCEQYKSIAS